jgi:DNA-binding NtrC family response regulator
LLRVLQEGEVTRVGSRRSTPVDVRIISATNVDLAAAMVAGSFRQDLFYRLHIVPVRLLPLRERAGDIKALAEYFIVHYSRRLKRLPPTLHQDALDAFTRYSWPGNIRELENVIYFSLLVDPTSEIRVEHLRLPGDPASRTRTGDLALVQGRDPLDRLGELLQSFFTRPGANLLRDIERRIVADAFRHCDSNQVRTAELLGVSRNVIRRMLKCHGLLTDGESGDDDDAGAPVDVLHYFGSSRLAEAGVVRRHSETEEVLV